MKKLHNLLFIGLLSVWSYSASAQTIVLRYFCSRLNESLRRIAVQPVHFTMDVREIGDFHGTVQVLEVYLPL